MVDALCPVLKKTALELVDAAVMLDRTELMERDLDTSNTICSYLNPHKGLLDTLADQVMGSIAGNPFDEPNRVEEPSEEISTMFIAVQTQYCPCVTCNVMRKL